MRIISGSHKGRRLTVLKSIKVRPTTDIAKEGLFNIIDNSLDITELKVLDLFGGTGSISYEFASRGANEVTTVDINSEHTNYIKKTIEKLKLKNIHTVRADCFKFIKRSSQTYNFIFADPPYDIDDIETIPNLIFKHKRLEEKGCLVLEHSKYLDFKDNKYFLCKRTYGNVNFSFFLNSTENLLPVTP